MQFAKVSFVYWYLCFLYDLLFVIFSVQLIYLAYTCSSSCNYYNDNKYDCNYYFVTGRLGVFTYLMVHKSKISAA